MQVDVHLTNFIADLKLRQADPLAHLPMLTVAQASSQQHSRLAALTLPLTVPDSQSEHDSNASQSCQAETVMPDALQEGSADSQAAETTTAEAMSRGRLSRHFKFDGDRQPMRFSHVDS